MQGGSFERRKGGHAPLGSPMVVEATTKGEPRARFAQAFPMVVEATTKGETRARFAAAASFLAIGWKLSKGQCRLNLFPS